ncbi:MAG: hypothetical protein ACI86C_002034 [Candidatus Latescibacterota bacterium]
MILSKEHIETLNKLGYNSKIINSILILKPKFNWISVIGLALAAFALYGIVFSNNKPISLRIQDSYFYVLFGSTLLLFILNIVKDTVNKIEISSSSVKVKWHSWNAKSLSIDTSEIIEVVLEKKKNGYGGIYLILDDEKRIRIISLGKIQEKNNLVVGQLLNELRKLIKTTS